MNEIIAAIRKFIRETFSLEEDKAEEEEIVANIHRDVHFKGTNLWTLIFAIMIASIGLNVNSTAVVIGAMLISPLMGPLMGIGLAVGTNDFDLLQRGIKNLAIAAIISVITSTIYFSITPLHDARSELLARTNPSVWDVFIALFGGFAGIVAGTRTIKNNVLPGVAIATALMPPLCTAGFGLATGQWRYFFGAAYLFFINSLFICLAAFIIVKHLGFHKKQFQTRSIERRVLRYIWIIVTITVLPSIYLGYRIVQRSIFENSAKSYVQNEFNFPRTQVVTRNFRIDGRKKYIDLLVVGQELSPDVIDSLKQRLQIYGLDSTKMIVRQGLNAQQKVDLAQIKASILEDVFREEKQRDTLIIPVLKIERPIPEIRAELRSLYPSIQSYSLQQSVFYNFDSTRRDTLTLMVANARGRFSQDERIRLQNWLKLRTNADSVKLVIE